MRRAKGAEHALDSFKIIERTVMGATICNCCGRDLFTILAGFAKPSEDYHTIMDAGSTVKLKRDLIDWTPKIKDVDTKQIVEMVELVEELHSEFTSRLDLLLSRKYPDEDATSLRSKICKLISLLVDPMIESSETVFLRGLTLAFFIDNAILGLDALNQLLSEVQTDHAFTIEALSKAKHLSLNEYDLDSLNASQTLVIAHCARVQRALQLHGLWAHD